ncbi:hypothetical protein GQR58_006088 [Nymphon striatum]|nr:hypothetical protein GQR58_006088 [Nymphon striatum]
MILLKPPVKPLKWGPGQVKCNKNIRVKWKTVMFESDLASFSLSPPPEVIYITIKFSSKIYRSPLHVYKLHPYIASLFITHFDNLGILYIIIWGDGLPCTLPLRFSRQSAPPADLRVRVSFFVFEVLLIKFIVLYIENENDELREFFVAD